MYKDKGGASANVSIFDWDVDANLLPNNAPIYWLFSIISHASKKSLVVFAIVIVVIYIVILSQQKQKTTLCSSIMPWLGDIRHSDRLCMEFTSSLHVIPKPRNHALCSIGDSELHRSASERVYVCVLQWAGRSPGCISHHCPPRHPTHIGFDAGGWMVHAIALCSC